MQAGCNRTHRAGGIQNGLAHVDAGAPLNKPSNTFLEKRCEDCKLLFWASDSRPPEERLP